MSDSSCARQRAHSSTFIVSESLFPIRSHGEYYLKVPLRVLVESTSRVIPTHYPRWHPSKSHPVKRKSQSVISKVRRKLAGEKDYNDHPDRGWHTISFTPQVVKRCVLDWLKRTNIRIQRTCDTVFTHLWFILSSPSTTSPVFLVYCHVRWLVSPVWCYHYVYSSTWMNLVNCLWLRVLFGVSINDFFIPIHLRCSSPQSIEVDSPHVNWMTSSSQRPRSRHHRWPTTGVKGVDVETSKSRLTWRTLRGLSTLSRIDV